MRIYKYNHHQSEKTGAEERKARKDKEEKASG
jgi:hypothetical protein